MNDLINDQLARLLNDLDHLPYMGRRDRIVTEVLETNGVYLIPNTLQPGARYICEITLHGIRATGGDEADVITNWIDAAHDQRAAA
ncbi:hypothetical protein LCM27_01950 [Ruegeria marisrubri]|uniref:hypothetical protein n=1 Tax=Ruegeria marisrubri TaxID=1685379 RepID=UPI001CD5D350|nr:hypothetical protein [Ruegeria marisrubri]MCA0905155.1 hypothetical protein [Ruegeria marisrubri]